MIGKTIGSEKTVSDETSHQIDSEIRTIIDLNHQIAFDLLKENEDQLHLMIDALMKYETIDASQIDSVMEGKIPGPPAHWGDDDGKDSSGKGDTTSNDSETDDDTDMLDPAKLH